MRDPLGAVHLAVAELRQQYVVEIEAIGRAPERARADSLGIRRAVLETSGRGARTLATAKKACRVAPGRPRAACAVGRLATEGDALDATAEPLDPALDALRRPRRKSEVVLLA